MNVFLSHSTRDKDFALRLQAALRLEGFTPWLCEMSIAPAENWVQEIENGLRVADLVLLLWSPDAAESFATRVEWTSALAREITERRLRLGIVMVKQHALPELIRTKQYIDATRNPDQGIGGVLQWLRERREAGRIAGKAAPVFLPDYRPQNFVGRKQHLEKLAESLIDRQGQFLLYGEPGTGKSTLALEFSWEAQRDFDAVLFQSCGQRSMDVIVGEMAEQLRGPLGEGVGQLPPEKKLAAIKDWLRGRHSLLVLDDVWLSNAASEDSAGLSAVALHSLLPGPPVSVLFTSRQRRIPGLQPNQMLAVEAFTPAEAEAVFAAYLGAETVALHREVLLDFAARVERLPIALAVGSELLCSQYDPLGEAVRGLSLKKLQDEVGNIRSVPDLFQRAIDAQGEQERRLLEAASVCAPDGFWLPLAAEITGLDQQQAAKARDNLVNASLMRVLDQERKRFQLHSLLREHIREGMSLLTDVREAHAKALERLFKDWETRWPECRECLEEIMPAREFVWGAGQNNRAAWLLFQGSACAYRIGELELALRILQHEENFWAGRDDYEAKTSLQISYGNQALILKAWGRLEEALALHKKQEAICLELGNKDSLQRSYGNQALILQAWGRLEEALALHKKKEAICLELGNRSSLAYCYWNLGILAREQDDHKTTQEKLRAALAIFTELKMPRERDAVQQELDNPD